MIIIEVKLECKFQTINAIYCFLILVLGLLYPNHTRILFEVNNTLTCSRRSGFIQDWRYCNVYCTMVRHLNSEKNCFNLKSSSRSRNQKNLFCFPLCGREICAVLSSSDNAGNYGELRLICHELDKFGDGDRHASSLAHPPCFCKVLLGSGCCGLSMFIEGYNCRELLANCVLFCKLHNQPVYYSSCQ